MQIRFLRSLVFFPVLVSTVGVGLTFTVLMHPDHGLINQALAQLGIEGPSWLTDPHYALLSVALVNAETGVVQDVAALGEAVSSPCQIDSGSRAKSSPRHRIRCPARRYSGKSSSAFW